MCTKCYGWLGGLVIIKSDDPLVQIQAKLRFAEGDGPRNENKVVLTGIGLGY